MAPFFPPVKQVTFLPQRLALGYYRQRDPPQLAPSSAVKTPPFEGHRVLAGDHWQLPPTVLSNEAMMQGFNRSILEVAIENIPAVYLLNTQYRMKPVIAGFSSDYFYKGLLQSAPHLVNSNVHLTFIDTAGSGFNETHGPDGMSLKNTGELDIVQQLLQSD